MAADWYSVCVLSSFIRLDSCLSASWAHAGRRCLLRTWCQEGESGAHADTLSRPENDAGESLPCLSGTHILSEEAMTAEAGDSARQNTKAEIGHDTWWTQMQREKLPSLPVFPPYIPYPTPSAEPHASLEEAKEDAWITLVWSWTLTYV